MAIEHYAILAEVSYANFNNVKNLKDGNLIKAELSGSRSGLSESQINSFVENYEVIKHISQPSNGYAGTIVKNKKSGELFVLHKGTENFQDWLEDAGLVVGGLPYRQLVEAKKFVDDNVKNGVLKTGFTNIGHSLGKSISDLVHFTTDRSKGVVGFNGAGSRFSDGSSPIHFNPALTTKILMEQGNRAILVGLAKQNGNAFNDKKSNVINIVSGGPSVVASSIPYDQHGKIIYMDNGSIGNHYIAPFLEPMEYVHKLSEAYKLSLEKSIEMYNIVQRYAYTFEPGKIMPRQDQSKVYSLVNEFIANNKFITASQVELFAKKSYLDNQKNAYSKINFSQYRYWPDYGAKAQNRLDITPSSHLQTKEIKDADYFDSTKHYKIALNREMLNEQTSAFAVSLSNIATDNFRVANFNLSKNALDTPNYSSRLGANFGSQLQKYTSLNWFSGVGRSRLPVDPLVLDLNGDGAKVVGYNEKPVLFDIDNDGGSLEETGWLSSADGLLVKDLNNNGKIDNMAEVFSEFYAGKAGKGGESGQKRFKNGFEALKTLDANKDKQFNSKDKEFGLVRVWQDANHNGITDANELKTLASLGITAIDLNYQEKGGQLFGGNELLASGSFIRTVKNKAQKQEVIAVNFLANPRGHTITNVNGGKKTVTEGSGLISGSSSFTAEDNKNRDLNAQTLGVLNIQAGNGNDILRGDAKDNWLAGNGGKDTFFGGDGNDVLLIDGDDLPANINGGKGDDIVQVIGDKAVSLDLGKAEVEVAHGGRGDDTFISSGNSSIFVRGGDGNDILWGSIANDALSGENGEDFISGNAGKDVIRGHRGNDRLFGDEGDDILFGGSDDDTLHGGSGNDTLLGEGGDDYLDGSDGEDVAEYSGNFADYKMTQMGDGVLISDKTQGRDGTDFLRNIEKLNFKDITNYGISSVQPQWENPVPVEDILYQDSNGQRFDGSRPYIIKRSLLLNNDIDPQGDPLRMNKIYNIRGGTLRVLTNSDLEFTPDKNFKGIASFEYGIEDIKKNSAQQTVGKGELRGKVYLVPPSLPTDPDIIRQYYLDADNILPVWNNYIGRNIRIGQFEPSGPFSVAEEVADYRHPELRHKMDKQWLHDYEYKRHEDDKVFSKHATEVAGIMVAERNGEGGIGVAHGATVASHWVGADISSLTKMKNYDVVNHSWGHTRNFSRQLEFTGNTTLFDLYKPTLTEGRKGLGTVIVNSAGNERANGGNSNYSELTNARYAIAVAAAEQNSSFETKIASYSNPGASILVAAHGSNAYSSSREVVNDNGSVLGQQYAQNSGTSFSAPVVSGVVALMLEANPYLGYRDVQEILALTATTKGVTDGRWQRNGAKNWNGGGMHINHDYGYGVIDAQAAVRLAQDWHSQHTYYNEVKLENAYKSANVNRAIGEGIEGGVDILRTAMQIENVSVKVNLTHSRASDLVIKLISPSGVESILMNRPGKNDSKTHGDVKFANSNILDYTFNTTLLKGESPNGHWKLQVLDVETGATGTLNHWSISFYGRTYDGSDTYVYTDEFHNTQAITTLNDNNGGNDTINAAAMNGVINVNLSTGKANLAGRALTIANPQQIENVTGGDYNDSLTGNNASNILVGGRGNDTLVGLDGHDFLAGGLGNNTLTGNQGNDSFIIEKKANSQDIVVDFVVGTDSLVFTGFSAFNWTKQQQGKDTLISLENGQTVRLNNVQANLLTNNHIVVTSEVFKPYWFTQTAFYGFANRNAESVLPHLDTAFWGTEGEDRLFGGNGNDVLRGGKGNDIIVGEHSSDTVHGGNDILYGGDSDDRIFGGGGNDTLYGGTGSDALFGGFGNDIIYLEGDDTALSPTYRNQQNAAIGQYTNVELSWAGAQGGKGSDRFIVVKDTSSNASKGLLKNLILDFDINDKNEKIELSQFKGLSDLYFESFVVNNELYTRIWLGAAPKADTQYITLKGISFEQLKGKDIFITSQEDPTELPRLQQALTGVATNDVIKGNAVGNFIDGRAGADTMSGEFGDDTYIVDNVGDKVVEVIDGGYDVVKSSVSYTLSNYVEELQLTGKAAINAIGNNENNRLVGNSGNNQLDGKSGFDTMLGYEGNDTYIVDSHLDKVIEKVNHGIDNVSSSVSYTLPENVEHLVLVGNSSISATGNSAHNSMKGNAGNNRLIGYDGNDTLNGMQGKDFLMGGKGNDTYQFNRGDGIDNIYDEQGSDTLRFTNVNHNQLWLRKLNTDLEVSVIGTSDKVIITDWYGKNYKVENITAANNKTLSHANVDKLVSAMAGFAPPAGGQISLPQAINTALTPVLTANWK